MTILEALGSRCNQCGHCCRNQHEHPLMITGYDLERWEGAGAAGREIIAWLSLSADALGAPRIECWFDPDTASPWSGRDCPWLERDAERRYYCGIYELRPEVCRDFPLSRDQVEAHCIPGGLLVTFDPQPR